MGSGKTTVKATHHGSGNTKWTSYDTVALNSPGSIMNYYTSEDVLKANDTDYSVKVVLHIHLNLMVVKCINAIIKSKKCEISFFAFSL